MASKNFLNNLTIPEPCAADWDKMVGNDQVRFCEHCSHEVHNLSRLTRSQAERLISRSNGRLCVRYHQGPAGKPITLPVARKLHSIGRRVSRLAAGAFTATLSITSAVAQNSASSQSGNFNLPSVMQPEVRGGFGSSISGTVKDQNGAVIPGATVFVSNTQLGVALYASTDFSGRFKIDNLAAGVYQVRIEATGFAPEEMEGVHMGGMVAFVAPENPFVRAAQEDDLEKLTSLIAGMDVNLRDKRSNTTALEHAVRNANREMVQLLLNAGAKVNTRNEAGATVLMMLDADATSDLLWDLINGGAEVNLKDTDNNTALMNAATVNNLDAVKTLIEAGAEVSLKNKQGRTALMLAASEGYVNIVRALVLSGANIDAVDEDDANALALAVENDHLAVVRFLRSKGAFDRVAKVEKEE
jgi:ankyrin repeat protein